MHHRGPRDQEVLLSGRARLTHLLRQLPDDGMLWLLRRHLAGHELEDAPLATPARWDHAHARASRDKPVAGAHLAELGRLGAQPLWIKADATVHALMLDRYPLFPIAHLRRVVGGDVETIGKDAVGGCLGQRDPAFPHDLRAVITNGSEDLLSCFWSDAVTLIRA